MKTAAAAAVAACLCVIALPGRGYEGPRPSGPSAAQQGPQRDWFEELDTWLSAVDRHEFGTADAAAQAIASWTRDRLTRMLGDILDIRKRMSVYRDRKNAEIRRLAPGRIEQLFRITEEERLAANLDRVLRRGAVLHADIGRFARDLPEPPGVKEIIVRLSDARQASIGPGTLHWRFGRDVVAALDENPAASRFVPAWYLATGAFMQGDRLLTLAAEHLAEARRVVPDDPAILFASACAVETLASRRVQSELSGVALPAGYTLERTPLPKLEEEAIALFGRALLRDPSRREARVRMARLLGARGRHDEALAELQQALRGPSSPTLDYFAWLFTGDEELALGRRAEATAAYERAAALFGDTASAPIVALARLAREYGDREALAKALDRWWAVPADGLDPWSLYYFMQGNDVDLRMDLLYALAGRRAR